MKAKPDVFRDFGIVPRNELVQLGEAFMGRVRGVEIRFRDKRTPIRIL